MGVKYIVFVKRSCSHAADHQGQKYKFVLQSPPWAISPELVLSW